MGLGPLGLLRPQLLQLREPPRPAGHLVRPTLLRRPTGPSLARIDSPNLAAVHPFPGPPLQPRQLLRPP